MSIFGDVSPQDEGLKLAAVPDESLEYAETERQLISWGRWAARLSNQLGYPRSSGIARMIEMVKVFDGQKREGRNETAKGKQTRVMKTPTIHVVQEIMEIDAQIAKLPGPMNQAISRSYLYKQPDRIAAKELGITREVYTLRREAAVSYLAERLHFSKF